MTYVLSYVSFLAIIGCSQSLVYLRNTQGLAAVNWGFPLAGHRLGVTPLATGKAKNRVKCMSQCTQTDGCRSVNLGPKVGDEHVCELLEYDRYTMMLNMSAETDWTYIGIKTKCDKNPCSGNKICVPDHERNTHNCIGPEDDNCQQLLNKGIHLSGRYLAHVAGRYVPVYCDQTTDGGGWLVIQKNDGVSDFDKTWEAYKQGFGNMADSFWWGNEKIHQVTSGKNYQLRVDLKTSTGSTGYATYELFKLSSESDGYRLLMNATSYTGNIGDSLHGGVDANNLSGKQFTTTDRDHDICSGCNCATLAKGGWWYGHCAIGALNGVTYEWRTWSQYTQITDTEMKIRPM